MDWSYQDTAGNQYRLKAIATNRLTGEKEAVYIDCQTQEIMVDSLSSFEQWVDLVDSPTKETRLTVQEKIKLYRTRFNGRSDIYAKRYYNKKAQRDVYSPATGFIDGRPNRDDLLPLTDEVVKEHLQGKIFIGIYPLLRDDTCNFLVIDIDKHNWKEITKSLSKVCRQFEIPIAVERSQSGNGAHLWVFFAHKMAAELARQFGQAILKRAMAINTSISFSAFDRLFPSQNHLTQKGFGNLIAAPLQYQRMKLGNSLFIDEDFKPYKNQWEFLAQIKLMDERRVKEAIGKLEEGNTFRLFQQLDTYEPDLLKDDLLTIKTGIKIIRSDQLYIDMADLNSRQINALRWAATFDNPDFYKKQKQRLSTWDTPRYVSLASHQGKYLVLPRGVEWFLAARLPQPNFIDKTESGSSLHVQFTGELRSEQLTAQEALLKQRMGVLAARTGFGKTVIAASMIAEKAVSTLVIVNNRELANQWQKQLLHFLEITDEPWVELTKTGRKKKKSIIGTYFSGHKSVSRLVDVATVQTLSRMKNLPEFLQHYGMVIIDEVHHLAAVTFDDVIKQSPARYVYGLSATPYRRDGWDPIIFMRAGKIAYRTAKTDEHQLLTTTRTVVLRPTGLGELNGGVMSQNSMQDNYEAMIKDQDRNRLIVNDILENFKQNKHQLVLTQRLEQIDVLKMALARWSEITVFELSGH
ncbi:TOTE conflict system archaeo-eukaryotic primase domain-containing protein [Levilactobacillus mulengensis]|uniref:TOTE conflict system archaeo-eukaryotic primase domain-containing protein n=1 Tax=Levilactobacillus mulengensis TaxID=2486025 RepID=UPI000F7929B3|nr:DEAD/DEAH box helicase family protein [Levilactobacillus mulengensis]